LIACADLLGVNRVHRGFWERRILGATDFGSDQTPRD
jgi:hypothetical protein